MASGPACQTHDDLDVPHRQKRLDEPPLQFHVRDESRDQDQIEGAITYHLVGDVHIATQRVTGLRSHPQFLPADGRPGRDPPSASSPVAVAHPGMGERSPSLRHIGGPGHVKMGRRRLASGRTQQTSQSTGLLSALLHPPACAGRAVAAGPGSWPCLTSRPSPVWYTHLATRRAGSLTSKNTSP
jgi:hypothetical protein